MRVLMQSRSNFYTLRGGDTVQLLKTKNELEKLGVEVDISLELEPDLRRYDIVHLSNLTRIQETYIQMKNARKQNKPIALSTIYWPTEEFEKVGQVGWRKILNKLIDINKEERLKAVYRYITSKEERNRATTELIKNKYMDMQKEVLMAADCCLPNSKTEIEKIEEVLGVKIDKYIVVPNGIDKNIVEKSNEENTEYEKYQDAVICVGRIDTRKNQLNLVRALDGSGKKLILVGAVSKNHRRYFEQISPYLERNEQFEYIPYIENEKLYQLYRVCKVNALPSWFDTPGLVSLEAAAMGCNLAISSKGTTRDYFGDYAYYCEPDNIDSIREAVLSAWHAPRIPELKAKVLSCYTWEQAAAQTLKCYREILKIRSEVTVKGK